MFILWIRPLAGWTLPSVRFCVGRSLQGAQVNHSLQQCRRREKGLFKTGLREALYYNGILPDTGCGDCRIPIPSCNNWAKNDHGDFVANESICQCQYSLTFVSGIVLGLYYCGKSEFRSEILDEVLDSVEDADCYDEESVACFLARPLTVHEVQASYMMRTVGWLTRMVWDMYGEGPSNSINLGSDALVLIQ